MLSLCPREAVHLVGRATALQRPKVVLTFFPSTQAAESKTKRQDDCVVIGDSAPSRAWITAAVAALYRQRRTADQLFPLTASNYLRVFHASRRMARLPSSHPHRLRHGGASADGANHVEEAIVRRRGRWATRRSTTRYTKPARYLRQQALVEHRAGEVTVAEAFLKRHLAEKVSALATTASPAARKRKSRSM